MIQIVRYALSRPYSIAALCLIIFFGGLIGYSRLPVDVLPSVKIPSIKVIWTYEGLNAKDMASKITGFSEVAIMNNVDNVREISSKSLNGASIITVDFQPQVDIANAMAQTASVSQTIIRRMPDGITPPLITQYSPSSTPIIQLVMSSNSMTNAELHDYARLRLRGMIQSINGVRMTLPYGGAARKIMVDIDSDTLFSLGLTPSDIIETINTQNLTLPSGSIRENNQDLQIALNASPESIDEFRAIPVTLPGGDVITLDDVASVRDGTAMQTNIARVNGQNGVIVSLIKLGDTSTVDIINQVMDKLPEIRAASPEGMTINPIFDQSVFVSTALDHIQKEIILVGALVALVVLLFLGSWRATLIVLTSIPLSLLSAIFVLHVTGNTLNLMSLGGLALAIGILVDNALVEIENIKRNLSEGQSPHHAIVLSAKQVAFPELVSTLSICVVFSPIFMLSGISGYIFQPIAIVVISALLTSFVLSRTVVPVLASILLKNDNNHDRGPIAKIYHGVESGLGRLRLGLERTTSRFQKYKIFVPLLFLGLIGVGGLAYQGLGQNFFPKTDAGLMRFYVRVDSGTRIEETARQFADIQNEIRQIIPENELDFVVENIGMPESVNMAWVNSFNVGSFDGEIQIQLKKGHAPTEAYQHEIRQMIAEKFPSVSFFALPADTINQTLSGDTPTSFDIRLSGRDMAGNIKLANQMVARLQNVEGAVDIGIQQVFNLPQYSLTIDRARAAELGVSARNIVSEILGILGYAGSVNSSFWSDPSSGFSYAVQTQSTPNDMRSVQDLMNVTVRSPVTDEQIPLRSIITVSEKNGPAMIGRATLRPVVNVLVNSHERDLGALFVDINKIVEEMREDLKPGNYIQVMGQAYSMQAAYADLMFGLMAAVIFIYIIMLFNFASWILPVVALSSVPIAISGGLIGLYLTGTPITVPALMGFIMVMGVSTANSVLVVTFARELWLSGYSSVKAARLAAGQRLRPVLMTALTMILGLIPMALALGEGAEQNAPLARVVIGGLFLGTWASLLFVPWFFAVIMKRLNKKQPLDVNPQLELERA